MYVLSNKKNKSKKKPRSALPNMVILLPNKVSSLPNMVILLPNKEQKQTIVIVLLQK